MVSRFWIKRYAEFIPKRDLEKVPYGVRGIYALSKRRHVTDKHKKARYDVVYVGMSKNNILKRLRTHRKRKDEFWNYFSIFEADKGTSKRAITDMEGILRYIYRKDSKANRLNVAKKYKRLTRRFIPIDDWKEG